jgi:hypothetical protein
LYTINPTIHSPLIGFAYDGFPIYGAFGYTNTNGTGGISRMKSSYQLRNITTRTTYADGTDVVDGPTISSTFPLGWYREDYEYIAHPTDPTYLDEHNGRFCITPEYPSGIYCYFSTVDSNYNSTYPYCVGPTYYGVKNVVKVTAVTESTTPYLDTMTFEKNDFSITIAPNPAQDFIAIQSQMAYSDYKIELIDELGKVVANSVIIKGSTLSVIDVQTVYSGTYFVKISNENATKTYKVIIDK